MTIADLLRELSALPPHLQVACALDIGESTDIDTEGNEVTINIMKECDCYGLDAVQNMGTWVRLVAGGVHFG